MSTESKFPPLVIQLAGSSESNWILEGTEKDPKRMSWPSLFRIVPTSKIREDIPADEGGGYRYKTIRHIAGCDFIDPVRQEKEGYKANLEQDNIWVNNGTMTTVHEGSTIGTYLYLKAYQGNANNPLRPIDAEVEFTEVIAVEVAKNVNVSFDKKADAYEILRSVRTPAEEGFTYDEEKLALMSTLFDLNYLETAEEKFSELYMIADTRPEMIVNSIANGKKKLFATIKKAEELNVISFSDEKVIFTDTKTPLLVFKTKLAKNNQINRLADHLLTQDGKHFLDQLNQAVLTAGTKSLERVQ